MNKTAFDRFRAETGAALDELSCGRDCTRWRAICGIRSRRQELFVRDTTSTTFRWAWNHGKLFLRDNLRSCVYAWKPCLHEPLTGRTVAGQQLHSSFTCTCDRIICLVCQCAVLFPT